MKIIDARERTISYEKQVDRWADSHSIHTVSSTSTICNDDPTADKPSSKYEAKQSNVAISDNAGPSVVPDAIVRSHAAKVQGLQTQPQVVTPIREVAQRGVIGQLYVHYRLWRMSSKLREPRVTFPDQYYEDLIELQRMDRYPQSMMQRAWTLLMRLNKLGHSQQIATALMKFPRPDVTIFLRTMALQNTDPNHKWTEPGNATIINIIQYDSPNFMNNSLTLSEFILLLIHTDEESSPNTLARFFDMLARHPWDFQSDFGDLGNWSLPEYGECLIRFLVSSSPTVIRTVATHIVRSIRPFAERESIFVLNQGIFRTHQALRSPTLMHPTFPFFLFATHLAYQSQVAAQMFVNIGLLKLVGLLWIHDFPDPRGRDASAFHRRRNDMRIACLLLIGAISRHIPSTITFADGLLQTHVREDFELDPIFHTTDQLAKSLKSKDRPHASLKSTSHVRKVQSPSPIHVKLPTLPSWAWLNPAFVSPMLSLSFFEICVSNRVPLASQEAGDTKSWDKILNLLSRPDFDNCAKEIKDASVRIILSCAAAPEEDWKDLVESLYNWEYSGCNAVLSYIIHSYLGVRNPANMDNNAIEHLERLRSLARENAAILTTIIKTPESEIINPVDRFIMLVQRASTSRHFSAVAYEAGVPDLISAVLHGHYDSFGSEEGLTDNQRKLRNTICSQLLNRLEQVHDERSQEVTQRMRNPWWTHDGFELRSATQFDSRWRI